MKRLLGLILVLAVFLLTGCSFEKADNEILRYDLYSAKDENITETTSDGGGGFLLIAAWFHYDSQTTQLYETTFWVTREDGGIVRFTLKEGKFDMKTIVVFPNLVEEAVPYIEIECDGNCGYSAFSNKFFKYDVEEIRVYIPENAFINPDILLDE